jgi:hypothetical protein
MGTANCFLRICQAHPLCIAQKQLHIHPNTLKLINFTKKIPTTLFIAKTLYLKALNT